MKKFFRFLVLCTLVFIGLKALPKKSEEFYVIKPNNFSTSVKLAKESKVIMLMRNQTLFIKNNKSHCIQKVLFFNFTSGYVECGHQMMDTVYHVYGSDNLPDQMHFTQKELNL